MEDNTISNANREFGYYLRNNDIDKCQNLWKRHHSNQDFINNAAYWSSLYLNNYAYDGTPSNIRFLVEVCGANIDDRNPRGQTPLMIAARYGIPENVICLLELGADPTLEDNFRNTPLSLAESRKINKIWESMGGITWDEATDEIITILKTPNIKSASKA